MSESADTIRSTLQNLSPVERKRLMYAFENMMTELIVFPDRTFIGCNLKYLEPLIVEGAHGPWMVGKLKPKE